MSVFRLDRGARTAAQATLAVIIALASAACGVHGGAAGEVGTVRPRVSETREVVRADQFPQAGSTYDIIAMLRPEFLRARAGDRGLQAPVLPAAYLDDVQLMDLSILRQIPIAWVVEIRYLHASAASARFGHRHEAGAIVVTTARLSP